MLYSNSTSFRRLCMLMLCILYYSGYAQNVEKNHHTISGKLHLDKEWDPIIYLSYISSFDELYALSSEMIIIGSKIDSTGAFIFDIDFLPKEDRLYRLHITKKGAPVSSLIIGGKDQNHLFIVANNNSSIVIEGSKKAIFNKALIKGNNHNGSLLRIDQVAGYLDSISFETTALQRDLETKVIYDKLRMIADTSSHSLVSLYALYKTRFRSDFEKHTDYYNRYYEKWKNENSSYFQTFRREVPVKKENGVIVYLVIALLLFFVMVSAYLLYKRKRSNSQDQIAALSVQERKVFALLELGKSNKEISQELNIGVNTVKSHVSSIYSKLDISSRKEVLKFR